MGIALFMGVFLSIKSNYILDYESTVMERVLHVKDIEVCHKQNGIVRHVNCIAQKYFLVRYLSQIRSQLLSN